MRQAAEPAPARAPSRWRALRALLAVLALSCAGLALSSAPALAAHHFSKALTAPPGGFSGPFGLAVGPAGEVWVDNRDGSTVDVYSSTGAFETEFSDGLPVTESEGIAVDDSATSPSKGDLYVADLEGSVLKYEYNSGTKKATKLASITGLSEPYAVAVDSSGGPSSGDLYVLQHGHSVNKYGPTGTLITSGLFKTATEPQAMAVDASGNIYVAISSGVYEYNESGTCLNACAAFAGVTEKTLGITVGPEGYVYLDPEASETEVFKSNGTLVEKFAPPFLIERGTGIGVSGTTVFVTNFFENEVDMFIEGAVKDKLTITKAGTGSGKVECEVNKTGGFVKCELEYAEGTELTIRGKANPGSTFSPGWSGGTGSASVCTGTTNCTFKIKAASAITATFPENTPVEFTPTVVGTGEVKCEVDKEGGFVKCELEYAEGTELTIEGVAGGGWTFEGWSAGTGSASACTGTANCQFTITKATTITATFGIASVFPLTVHVTGKGEVNGGVIVKCTSSGGTCTEPTKGKVILTATAEPGSRCSPAGSVSAK